MPDGPIAIEAKARLELGWDWGKGATKPQFQSHLENKALTRVARHSTDIHLTANEISGK
jgi:hypothetical protein